MIYTLALETVHALVNNMETSIFFRAQTITNII